MEQTLNQLLHSVRDIAEHTSGKGWYFDQIEQEIAKKREKRELYETSKGRMNTLLSVQLPLTIDEILLVEVISPKERAIIHSWAALHNLPHHLPITTDHFSHHYIYKCHECDTISDDDQINSYSDMGMLLPHSYLGTWFKCPHCLEGAWKLDFIGSEKTYSDDDDTFGMTRRQQPNAILICHQLPSTLPASAQQYQQKRLSQTNQETTLQQMTQMPERRIHKLKLTDDLNLPSD